MSSSTKKPGRPSSLVKDENNDDDDEIIKDVPNNVKKEEENVKIKKEDTTSREAMIKMGKIDAKRVFEKEVSDIYDEIPEKYTKAFKQIGFAPWMRKMLPCMILSPYDVPPGIVREGWLTFYEKWRTKAIPLKHVIYWYGSENPGDYYGFCQHEKFIPYEKASDKEKHIPQTIQTKIDKKMKLTKIEQATLKAYEEMEEDLLKKPEERKRGNINFKEVYDDMSDSEYLLRGKALLRPDDDDDDSSEDDGNYDVIEAVHTEQKPKKKKKIKREREGYPDDENESPKKKKAKKRGRPPKVKVEDDDDIGDADADSESDVPKKKKKTTKKRGRPPKNSIDTTNSESATADADASSTPKTKKKRGRPPKKAITTTTVGDVGDADSDDESDHEDSIKEKKKKKDKKKNSVIAHSDDEEEEEQLSTTPQDRKIKREDDDDVDEADGVGSGVEDGSKSDDKDYESNESAADDEEEADGDFVPTKQRGESKLKGRKGRKEKKIKRESVEKKRVKKEPSDKKKKQIEQRAFTECEEKYLYIVKELEESINTGDIDKILNIHFDEMDKVLDNFSATFIAECVINVFKKSKQVLKQANVSLDKFMNLKNRMKDIHTKKSDMVPKGFKPKHNNTQQQNGKDIKVIDETNKIPGSPVERSETVKQEDSGHNNNNNMIDKSERSTTSLKKASSTSLKQLGGGGGDAKDTTTAPAAQVQQQKPERKKFSLGSLMGTGTSKPLSRQNSTKELPNKVKTGAASSSIKGHNAPEWYSPGSTITLDPPIEDVRLLAIEYLLQTGKVFPSDKVDTEIFALSLESSIYNSITHGLLMIDTTWVTRYWEKVYSIVAAINGKQQNRGSEKGSLYHLILSGQIDNPTKIAELSDDILADSFEGKPINII